MTQVHWLVEEEGFNLDLEPLLSEIKAQGHGLKIHNHVPFEGSDKYLGLFDKDDCVVFYGSLQFGKQIQRQAPWIPGVYCSLEKFECTYYYPFFGSWLLNGNYVMLPYGELKRRKDFLLETLSNNGAVFVRPSSGFKIFTGKVIYAESWAKDVENLGFYDVDPERVVVVAEPHNLDGEWRFIVVKGRVVAGSQYRSAIGVKYSEVIAPEIYEFAQKVVDSAKYEPDPAWCLDVCRRKDGELFVLEVGCFSSAGLYAASKSDIVREVSKVALEEWNDLKGKD